MGCQNNGRQALPILVRPWFRLRHKTGAGLSDIRRLERSIYRNIGITGGPAVLATRPRYTQRDWAPAAAIRPGVCGTSGRIMFP
jgi:hypothetical protein